jgi:hypothetical protein
MKRRFVMVAAALSLAALPSLSARVVRVEVLSRADVLEGKAFGEAGSYEKLAGKVHFAVKPDDPHNKVIVDLEKGPRNAAGEVEFAADFYVLRPKDAARASGTLLLEIPNRGGKSLLALMQGGKGSRDPATEEELGDGFLMRRGVVVAWLGWQWDVREETGLMRLYAPVAREGEIHEEKKTPNAQRRTPNAQSDPKGKPITGLVRADFTVNERVEEHPVGHLIGGNIGGTEYSAWRPDDPANVLTVRDGPMEKRRTVPRNDWEFAGGTAKPGAQTVRLKGGFEPGKIYELVYQARDPAIAGLGLAAVRDFASYVKEENNELAPAKRVCAAGISQSGRFLRLFLLEAFNADENNRRAIDGMLVHVAAAGIGSFNHRFAQPSRDAQPTSALFYPTDLFPFTDSMQIDPETGQTAGLLDRLRLASGGDGGAASRRSKIAGGSTLLPKVFYTNTSYEYWSRAASLIHTSPDGKRDIPPLENSRIYLFAGLQHYSRPFPPVPETDLPSVHLPNPNPVRWFWRALFVAMDDWVRGGTAPPENRYPKLADKTLVRREDFRFPAIPAVSVPERVHQALRLDFGPQWKKRIITKQPPGVGKPFPVFVPQVDKDGNDLGGVRLPELEVPLATYTGWNLRDPKSGMPAERVSFLGSFFPFSKTKADADAGHDPRQAIADRYPSREDYLKKFADAAQKLAGERFLLRQDLDALVTRGGEEWDFVTK